MYIVYVVYIIYYDINFIERFSEQFENIFPRESVIEGIYL